MMTLIFVLTGVQILLITTAIITANSTEEEDEQ